MIPRIWSAADVAREAVRSLGPHYSAVERGECLLVQDNICHQQRYLMVATILNEPDIGAFVAEAFGDAR